MKRILTAILALSMLMLCGCSTVVLGNGTLELDANDVDHIVIESELTGKTFSIADRESISTIISHINSFTLEENAEPGSGYCYQLTTVARSNGGAETHFSVGENTFVSQNVPYAVDAADFLRYLEGLECDTLTDNELIDYLMDQDTLGRLNVLDADGKISMDKIVRLPQSCPALFELLRRPSAIASVGSYGVEKIQGFLNSNNPELVQKAEEWIEILKQLLPEAKDKLEELLSK